MSILTHFLKDDKENFIGKISDFFQDYVSRKLRRDCSLSKAADRARDISDAGGQISFTDPMVINGNFVTGSFGSSEPWEGVQDVQDDLGIPADTLLLDKIAFPFLGEQSFYGLWMMNRKEGITNPYEKDTWYRFDKLHVNWEGLETGVAANVIAHISANTETHGYHGALAIDDSLFARKLGVHGNKSKGKATEFLGTV